MKPDDGGADAAAGAYHFLDMGDTKYGECILVEFGATRILIDGGHTGDFKGQDGYASIPEQLAEILGEDAPHDITLVVVTHGHSDHIGCLPQLVAEDVIRPKFALLTDPNAGFGRASDFDAGAFDAQDPRRILESLLREEDASDLSDAELERFIADAATVETRYRRFIADLKAKGVAIAFHRGGALPRAIAEAVKASGMKLLGPNEDQLLKCASQIARTNEDAMRAADALERGDSASIIALYRSIVARDARDNEDARGGRGDAMNCQSVTLAFGPKNARALLAGDMQFVKPSVEDVDDDVEALVSAVEAHGPYKLFKTTHHTSHNGQTAEFLDQLGAPPLLVHSGGKRDEHHPHPETLDWLRERTGRVFARTDRNGRITVRPHKPTKDAIEVSRGRLNIFTPNPGRDVPAAAETASTPASTAAPSTVQRPAAQAGGLQVIIVNLPDAPVDISVAGVDIIVRKPAQDGGARAAPRRTGSSGGGPARSAASLEGLLFVTDQPVLRSKIGAAADDAIGAIKDRGGVLLDEKGPGLRAATQQALADDPSIRGVVIVGGYDVAPALSTDAIGPELRNLLGDHVLDDNDHFHVWSDKAYGDRDGDFSPEVPVSRLPDAGDPGLIAAGLAASGGGARERFGVRNTFRPFADQIWSGVDGARALNASEPFVADDIIAGHLSAERHYFMLHGQEDDGAAFTGETPQGDYPIAFRASDVPKQFSGVVFTGCCWGALIARQSARRSQGTVPPPRTVGQSIALSYLKAGAKAFVGCTGAHYSGPSLDPARNYAMLLHEEFWRSLRGGAAPAEALHTARERFLRWIVSRGGQLEPIDTARRLKNAAQFTCLGLGW